MIHLRVATSLSDQDRLFIANWRPLPLKVSEQRPVFLSWLRTFQKSLANNGACEARGGPTAHWRKLQGRMKLRCSHEKCLIFKTKMQSSLWTQITNQQTVYQKKYPPGNTWSMWICISISSQSLCCWSVSSPERKLADFRYNLNVDPACDPSAWEAELGRTDISPWLA